MRDLPYLQQGLVPQEESGKAVKELDYSGEEHEKLTDNDVSELAQAFLSNDQFQGELELNKNGLTDLSALSLAPIFEKRSGMNITKLKLDDNNFTTKAGEYIGEALSSNPDYMLKKISFGGICLESIGLVRIVEACNLNRHVKKLDIGVITEQGLVTLAELLRENESLEELDIEETSDHQKYWTDVGRAAFV